MDDRYTKLLEMERPELPDFPRMSMYERAAQFSSFAALKGFDDEIDETGRQTESQSETDDDFGEILDRKIQILNDLMDLRPEIYLVYFVPDELKEGGKYLSISGILKKIDPVERKLIFEDGTSVDVNAVSDISASVFDPMEL